MATPRVWLSVFVLALALVLVASAASAQYMYLDSNGDGVHTAADQVNPAGPTTVDIWLSTDHNRDGSAAVCINGGTLNIVSYIVNLQASGGTVTWGAFENLMPTFGIHFPPISSSTEIQDGYGGYPDLPPGLYHLARLTASVLSGAPSIQIVPIVSIRFYDPTSFGSSCLGTNFDDTITLGTDWHDVDGLPIGAEGTQNHSPSLAQPSNMLVSTGVPQTQALNASDPDGQALQFSKAGGPAFLYVETLAPGNGTSQGEIYARPRSGDAGNATATAQVSDGFLSDAKSFSVAATEGPNHPPNLDGGSKVIVPTGRIMTRNLSAYDLDGQRLSFSLVSGPSYTTVQTLRTENGGAAGVLRIAPGPCDVGTATAVVAATDGITAGTRPITIDIVPDSPPPFAGVRTFPVPRLPGSLALADLNHDGFADAITAGEPSTGGLSVLLGHGDGTFGVATTVPGMNGGTWPLALATGDLNADAKPDVVLANPSVSALTVFLGNGDGSLQAGVDYTTGSGPQGVAIADLNLDGKPDLIASAEGLNAVSVLLGNGDGTFGPARLSGTGIDQTVGVAVADFNLDGIPDAAVGSGSGHSVSVLLGIGNGFFGPPAVTALGGSPDAVVAGDLNGDGAADLVLANFDTQRLHILMGHGDGTFTTPVDILSPQTSSPWGVALEDMNLDGRLDLLWSTADYIGFVANGNGDGTFAPPRRLAAYSAGLAAGRVDSDAYPDFVGLNFAGIDIQLNQSGVAAPQARSFSFPSNKTFSVGAGEPKVCLQLEPVADTYRNGDVNLSSLTLRSVGTGSVTTIAAIQGKTVLDDDTDHNGIGELAACFARDDFARLFDGVSGRATVSADLQGALLDGRPFCAPVSLTIVGTGHQLAASVSPNPFNPQTILRFSTSRPEFVRIRIYDLHGRVVRTILDQAQLEAGDHQISIDGRGNNGEKLASGIYFYEVSAQEGTVRGRLTILK